MKTHTYAERLNHNFKVKKDVTEAISKTAAFVKEPQGLLIAVRARRMATSLDTRSLSPTELYMEAAESVARDAAKVKGASENIRRTLLDEGDKLAYHAEYLAEQAGFIN